MTSRVLRDAVRDVFVHDAVSRWIVELVRATRGLDIVNIGSSVRGSIALNRAARAWAVLHGRSYATPEDVEQLIDPCPHAPAALPAELPRPDPRSRLGRGGARPPGAVASTLAPKPGFDIDLDVPAPAAV